MKKVFKSILKKAKRYYQDENDWLHLITALKMAEELILEEGGDEKIIIPAIILHDIGWYNFPLEEKIKLRKATTQLEVIKLRHEHEIQGASLAEEILSELNYPKKAIKQIAKIILAHDTRSKPISLEDMIVKEADRLSRYTPQGIKLWSALFKKDEEEWVGFLKDNIDKWLYTERAKFKAREYLLKRELVHLPEGGISSQFCPIFLQLQGNLINLIKGYLERIVINVAKEKVYDVKRMVEIYLANRESIDLKQLQMDEKFQSIATQKVGQGGYIGIIDRETGSVIFHPDKEIINLPMEELKNKKRPEEYLHGFWDWYNRALAGEEFYSYYQGINIGGEIADKFQYAVPIEIKKAKWSIIAAADYNEFFKSIDILSKEVTQSINQILKEVNCLSNLIEKRNKEIESVNLQLQFEMEERKRMEEKLIKTEKLALTSRITAEVAHEIKNPLQILKSGLYYLQMIIQKEGIDTDEIIEGMNNAINKINRFVEGLLDISRPLKPKISDIKIGETIKSAIFELPAQILSDIEITQKIDKDLPDIQADYHQLKQVIVNLLQNAVEAMTVSGKPKRIEIKAEQENGFVRINIRDTGVGIPEKELPHIFDLFHTTKPAGTGLGLSICERIIEAHQGKIEVKSKLGKGTTFIIRLPLSPNFTPF